MPVKIPEEINTGIAARIELLTAKSAMSIKKGVAGIHWHRCGDQFDLRATPAKRIA
jgi:hypothetical protein